MTLVIILSKAMITFHNHSFTFFQSSPSTSPRHSLGLITTRSSGVQPNFYVDSLRLPSPRPSSRYSDHGSHVSRNDATVTVLRQSPSPADTYASTTTTFNTGKYKLSFFRVE